MAKYGGFFLKGIAGGIQTGLQIAEMRWQKKERERIQKEKEEIMASASAFNKKIEEFYADKELSKDERLQLDTIYMTQGYNVQALIKGSYEAVVKLDKETEERNLALMKSYREAWADFDFDLSTIPELYEYYKGQTIGEKSKQIFDAGDRLLKKQYEAKQIKEPTMANYATGLKYLKDIVNVSPENWEMARKGLESKFGFDYSAITQEALGEVEDEAYNLYNTPEEVMASVKAPAGLNVIPKYDTKTDKYYATFSKEAVPKATPEEEMREYYQKQFGTFKRNLLSGINDLGFIIDPENRDKYLSMNFEEYMQFMQGEIPARFGDDITVTDQATGKEQSVKGETLFDKILNRLGLQKIPETEEVGGALGETVSPTEFQPEVTGVEMPKPGETIPTPKVPTEGKEALIPMMTKKELEDAIRGLDPSDPMYKLLYNEAVKRGYIKK